MGRLSRSEDSPGGVVEGETILFFFHGHPVVLSSTATSPTIETARSSVLVDTARRPLDRAAPATYRRAFAAGRTLAHVFISHRNDTDEDELAATLHAVLRRHGNSAFLDSADMRLGDDWARRIRDELSRADAFVVLLGPGAAASEMVAAEVAMARDLRKAHGDRPRLLPVRIRIDSEDLIPYDLGAYLNRLHYVSWWGPEDTANVVAKVLAVLEADAEPPQPAQPAASPLRSVTTAPVRPPGAMDVEHWYAPRVEAERDADVYLADHGSPVVLVGPHQIGKTYMLSRLLTTRPARDSAVVRLNLSYYAHDTLKHPDLLLREIALDMCEQLDLDPDLLEDEWATALPPARKLTRYVQRSLLGAVDGLLYLAIDCTDVVALLPTGQDFFAMLRRWAELGRRAPWSKLRLLLAVSTEPHLLSTSIERSPFNIVQPIRLDDLTGEQVLDLACRHGLDWGEAHAARLMSVVGGQPYLVRLALYRAAVHGDSLETILRGANREHSAFADHLQSRLLKLQGDSALAAAVRAVLDDPGADVDFATMDRLRRAGLLIGERGSYRHRYPLYQQFFRERL